MNDIRKQADEMLKNIGEVLKLRDQIQARADEAMREVTERYGKLLQPLNDRLKEKEKCIIALMKIGKKTFFAGTDIVRLENGVLIYNKEEKVKIPRDAVSRAEAEGLTDAIKIAKSLDRAVVETWPDEKLFLIGAERKLKDKFSYEISGQ